jgi:VanZ family protein
MMIWWCLLADGLGALFLITSLQVFTSEHTKVIVQHLIGVDEQHAYATNAVIRKAAHVLMFGMLSILFYLALRRRTSWLPWICTTLTAAIDECYQAYVPGRSASLQDVMLDSFSALLFLRVMAWLTSR